MVLNISSEFPTTSNVEKEAADVGLVQTGHLWCCHGPFDCPRAAFLEVNLDIPINERDQPLHPGECACEEGYVGEGCAPACHGCSGHGFCPQPNECQCMPGYVGHDCSSPLCLSPCFHGTCTAPGVCTCEKNYHGPMCDVYCDTHGIYVGDQPSASTKGMSRKEIDTMTRTQCKCLDGWTGDWCAEPVCRTVECLHGTCVAPNKCKCRSGWTGEDCNVMPSNGKFLFTEKDVALQRERKYKETLDELNIETKHLKLAKIKEKEKRQQEASQPWKPAWTNGEGKTQGRGGGAPRLAFEKKKYVGTYRTPAVTEDMHRPLNERSSPYHVDSEGGVWIGKGGSVRLRASNPYR